MKVIFLDIDGVLNSESFYNNNPEIDFHLQPFDPLSIICLKQIIKSTGAEIVLTSSWRAGWSKDPSKNQTEGKILNRVFARYGLSIFDKTPSLNTCKRPLEVVAYLKNCDQPIEEFLIIDDHDFSWSHYHMSHRFVQTDFEDGGLMDKHVEACIQILNTKYPVKDAVFKKMNHL